MRACRSRARRQAGFTVVELVVVSGLLVLLSLLLSAIWKGICLPTIDAAARARVVQEANLATAALARDLGGSLANPEGRLGAKTDGQFVGRQEPSGSWLRLCFHGGSSTDISPKWGAPDTVISYQAQGNTLVRWDENAGTIVTVARDLTAFTVTPLDDQSGITIAMTFAYRNVTLSYTLVAVDPPKS